MSSPLLLVPRSSCQKHDEIEVAMRPWTTLVLAVLLVGVLIAAVIQFVVLL